MAKSIPSPYQLLQVDQSAQGLPLRIAFRARIHELKEDRLKDSGSRRIPAEDFHLICRAYETLAYRKTRELYEGGEKQWTSSIPLSRLTSQQLAGEPDLLSELRRRLKNASLKEIDGQDPGTGHTPLYCASRAGNLEGVIFLIEQGANPDLPQKGGSTALHVSSFYGHPDVVRLILECGANYLTKNSFEGHGNLAESEIFREDVRTKEIFAQMKGEAYVQVAANQLQWLKDNFDALGHHIDEQYYRLRQTLLHCAAKKGYLELLRWLVEERHCNLDLVDINLNSALHLASYGDHPALVEYLLNRGANALLINRWGMTAEQEGLMHGNRISDLFRRIRARDMFDAAGKGEDWWFRYHFAKNSPNAANNEGTNLLYIAARSGQFAVAKWLLNHGANVNLQLSSGSRSTPLHGATFGGHAAIVELLLEHGADVNIKNQYGETVFENAKDEKIKRLLEKYRKNLRDDKFLSVHLYGDGKKSGDAPLAKLELHVTAKYTDLIEAMPEELRTKYRGFSIARRPLIFDKTETTVLSAVCGARCGKSKFVQMPLCITAHESARYMNSGHVVSTFLTNLNARDFRTKFLSQCHSETIHIRGGYEQAQTFQLKQLTLTFAGNCAEKDVTIKIDYILSPNNQTFEIAECLCLFQSEYSPINSPSRLTDLPVVSFDGDADAFLYNWVQPSPFWCATSTKHKRLPSIGGRHALIRHVQIIPKELTLPPDMFSPAAVGQLLTKRTSPLPCQALKIREHNGTDFPLIAYHGTAVKVIPSILMDGLVMPSTVVSSGHRVCPPPNHIARQTEAFGISDFSNGIFLSPSIHYCSDPVYAVTFSNGDQRLIAVLECAVKTNSFKSFPSTVKSYQAKGTDDIKNIEWRFTNPADIEIISILFIPVIDSRLAEAKSRAKKLSVDPNAIK